MKLTDNSLKTSIVNFFVIRNRNKFKRVFLWNSQADEL